MAKRGAVRIGTSGWAYPEWKGLFYPEALRLKDRFAYYASRFDTVEINGSFYRLPTEAAVAHWRDQAPEGFVFAWKVSRFITQMKRLKQVDESVALVYGRMAPLGDRLGPALVQLPPSLKRDDARLADFLALLPKGRRHTVEFRHPSWYAPEVFRLLAGHGVALCVSDHHDAPSPWEATADFAYVRGHGPGGRYVGRYPPGELDRWAARLAAWCERGVDSYAYFDNDVGGSAPLDAEALKARLA